MQDIELTLDRDHKVQRAMEVLKSAGADWSGYRKKRILALQIHSQNSEIDVDQKRILAELPRVRQRMEELKGQIARAKAQ